MSFFTLLFLSHLTLDNRSESFLLYSSSLILLLATCLHHFSLYAFISSYSKQHVPVILTLLKVIHLTLSKMSASFFSLRFPSLLTLSNMSASFFILLFLSHLALSNRSASFFTLPFSSHLTLSNRSASFITLLFSFVLLFATGLRHYLLY